jgi:hypothetical protein
VTIRIIPVTLFCCVAACSQDLPDSVLTLAHVKQRMSGMLAQTTNYTCLVTMERASQSAPNKPFRRLDTVRFEIANAAGRELFAWAGADRFEDQSIQTALPYGVSSTGEYALHARAVFTDGYASMQFAGRDHDALRWNFVIPLFGSGWTISNRGRRIRTGSHGSFWVNPKSLDVTRLEMYADDLPPGFANTAAFTWIDYARIQLGSRDILLPQTAGLVLDERPAKRNLNVLAFSHCRQYSAESSLSFDAGKAPSLSPPPSSTGKKQQLPSGIVLTLQLTTPIDSRTTAVGDPLTAITTSDVNHIPKGANVHGRVRRIERREGPPVQYALGVEFSELECNGRRVLFFGSLESLDPALKGLRGIVGAGTIEYQGSRDSDIQIYNIPEIPGVATLLIHATGFDIPQGTMMTWRTGKLKSNRLKAFSPNWAPGPSPSGR